MIDPFSISPKELGYSWVDENGKYWAWMTDRMRAHAVQTGKEIVRSPVDREFAQWVLTANGVEQHRLDRLTPAAMCLPVIYVILPTDKTAAGIHHKLVDGSHRYVKAAMMGWKELPAYLFDTKEAEEFQLDIPDHLNELAKSTIPTFSGIF
jgi:hypothetical protein